MIGNCEPQQISHRWSQLCFDEITNLLTINFLIYVFKISQFFLGSKARGLMDSNMNIKICIWEDNSFAKYSLSNDNNFTIWLNSPHPYKLVLFTRVQLVNFSKWQLLYFVEYKMKVNVPWVFVPWLYINIPVAR